MMDFVNYVGNLVLNEGETFHEDIHFKTIKKHPNYIIIIVLHIPHVDFVKEVHNTPHG